MDSIKLHKETGRPCAIYDNNESPRHSESNICFKLWNRLEYFWMVHMTPIMIICAGVLFSLLTILVIFLELSLFLNWDSDEDSSFFKTWTDYSESNKG